MSQRISKIYPRLRMDWYRGGIRHAIASVLCSAEDRGDGSLCGWRRLSPTINFSWAPHQTSNHSCAGVGAFTNLVRDILSQHPGDCETTWHSEALLTGAVRSGGTLA